MTPADETLAVGGGAGNGGVEAARAARWVGTHNLTDKQISALARHIVVQIRKRGKADKAPVLTLGEFVNRRPGPASGLQALRGLLQSAIEEANKEAGLYATDDGDPIAVPLKDPVPNSGALTGGNTAEGSPAFLLQGDILQAIGSYLTTHSDTLRIRAYGRAGDGGNRRRHGARPSSSGCRNTSMPALPRRTPRRRARSTSASAAASTSSRSAGSPAMKSDGHPVTHEKHPVAVDCRPLPSFAAQDGRAGHSFPHHVF